ncbi:MAG: penicillin-binding protein 2 [Burkholderiaceae bacterium]
MKSVRFHASPVLAVKLPAWRSRAVLALLFFAFLALLVRAIYLQAFSTGFLQSQGEQRYMTTIETPATRGKITDRNGDVLASSIPAYSIGVEVEDVDATPAELAEVARLLEMPLAEVKKKVADPVRRFVYLKRQVTPLVAQAIGKLGVPGIRQQKEFHREYPQGEMMAHVVGYTNVDDAGQEGIELAWQKSLAGLDGSRRVIRNRLNQPIEDVASIRAPHDGTDLTLSIDSRLQYLAFTELKKAVDFHRAKAGAIVVLDVRTGEVLALANLPTYDPNDRHKLTGEMLRNRVLTDTYEPGSTLKPFTIALALERGIVKPDTMIQTAGGKYTIGTNTISDTHAHGTITVEDVIKVSSNIGAAKIGLRMAPHDMWEMFTASGLGQAPKWGFPGAAAGRVRPFAKWRPIEQATMSYGMGLSVSLIQIARAYTMFARDGEIVPLTFFKSDQSKASAPWVKGTQVISARTAREMRHMLELAAGPGGTAPKAQVMGYRVAGKTGTAHKVTAHGGYDNSRYVGSFVGFAPVSNPRIVVAVMIDEPSNGIYYGGDVAAPVFSAVVGGALRTLNVEPDSPIKSLIIPSDAPKDAL